MQESMKDTLELNCERANELASLNLLLSEKRQELISSAAKGKRSLGQLEQAGRRPSSRIHSSTHSITTIPENVLRDLPKPTCRQGTVNQPDEPALAQASSDDRPSSTKLSSIMAGSDILFNQIQQMNTKTTAGAPRRSSDFQHQFEQSLSEPAQGLIEDSFRNRSQDRLQTSEQKPFQADDGANVLLYQQDHENEVFAGSSCSSGSSSYSEEDYERSEASESGSYS